MTTQRQLIRNNRTGPAGRTKGVRQELITQTHCKICRRTVFVDTEAYVWNMEPLGICHADCTGEYTAT